MLRSRLPKLLAGLTLLLCLSGTLGAQSATPKPVVVISELNSTRAIAFESVTFKREPFALTSPFAGDGRTRIMVFALNLDLQPHEDLSAVSAEATTAAGTHYSLEVEFAGSLPQLSWLSAVILRLNDELPTSGDVLINLSLRGVPSNRVRVGLGNIGGGPPDDAGAGPTPAPPYQISGRITDPEGQGVGGVNLILNGDQTAAFTTNDDGLFSFLINTFGNYSLTANKTFFDLTPSTRTFTNLGNNQTNINFSITRHLYAVTGKVVDDNNAPLANINLALVDKSTNVVVGSATTSAKGEFRFSNVPAGLPYEVQPLTNGVFDFTVKNIAVLDGDSILDFVGVRRSYRISGTLKSTNNTKLANIQVNLSGFRSDSVDTDVNGNYSFANLPAGFHYLVTVPQSVFYDFSPAQSLPNLSADSDASFTGTLRRYNITGRVTIAGNGVANNPVQITGTQTANTVTDSDGNYSFIGLEAAGGYLIETAPTALKSFPPQSVGLLFGNLTVNLTDVPRRYFITGRVADVDGTPLSGVNLNLSGFETGSARTNGMGIYSLSATVLADHTVSPSIEQDYYTFTPVSQSISNLFGDQVLNYSAVLKPAPDPGHVLEFDGSPKTVDYGDFFPAFTDLGHFFWEFWAVPNGNASSTYMLSDGYGGLHALLFGFGNANSSEPGRYEMFGNINDGVIDAFHVVSFGSDHGPAPGEWGHYAVGWDGLNIITYFNGVPVGKTPYAKKRQSTGPGTGSGRLLIGGSDHNNFPGRIAQVRGYEGSNPRETTSVESSFAPQTVFSREGNLLSYYFTPAPKVADLSRGFITGSHVGTPRGTISGVLTDCGSCPPPQFVIDPTAPNFATNTPPQQVLVATPDPVPPGSLVFDSFARVNSTYMFGSKGGLGSTQGGSAGVQVWQMLEGQSQLKPFGILNGRAVLLADAPALAWVNSNSATGNLDIRVNRRRGRWGSGSNTGLAFRVVDESNYFFAYTTDSIATPGRQFLTVGNYINGVRSTFSSGSLLPTNWTTVRVITRANGSITVLVDNSPLFSTTSSQLVSATKAGLFNNGPGLGLVNRWDNFTIVDAGP